MPDVTLAWDAANARCDWVAAPGGVAEGGDLATAVLVSLFTDAAAPPAAAPALDPDPRGWWADAYAERPLGSRLWRLDRAVRREGTLRDAEGYARDALRWLVDDRVALRVDVVASWASRTALVLEVTVAKPDRVETRFSFVWEF